MRRNVRKLLMLLALCLVCLGVVKAGAASEPIVPATPDVPVLVEQSGSSFVFKWNYDPQIASYIKNGLFGYELTFMNKNGQVIATENLSEYSSYLKSDYTSMVYAVVNNTALKKQAFTVTVRAYVDDRYSAASEANYIVPHPTVIDFSKNKIIKWEKVAGAKKYNVYFSTNGKKFKKIGTTSKRSFKINKKMTMNKKYYVYIDAVGKGFKSTVPTIIPGVSASKGMESNASKIWLKRY
ncbi:MAG: hypothetical protein Q4B57_00160 [Eubacteriales bacterium]|nr:hypothetical protein [Eubacteriales bacterium]